MEGYNNRLGPGDTFSNHNHPLYAPEYPRILNPHSMDCRCMTCAPPSFAASAYGANDSRSYAFPDTASTRTPYDTALLQRMRHDGLGHGQPSRTALPAFGGPAYGLDRGVFSSPAIDSPFYPSMQDHPHATPISGQPVPLNGIRPFFFEGTDDVVNRPELSYAIDAMTASHEAYQPVSPSGVCRYFSMRGGLFEWAGDVVNRPAFSGATHATTASHDAYQPVPQFRGRRFSFTRGDDANFMSYGRAPLSRVLSRAVPLTGVRRYSFTRGDDANSLPSAYAPQYRGANRPVSPVGVRPFSFRRGDDANLHGYARQAGVAAGSTASRLVSPVGVSPRSSVRHDEASSTLQTGANAAVQAGRPHASVGLPQYYPSIGDGDASHPQQRDANGVFTATHPSSSPPAQQQHPSNSNNLASDTQQAGVNAVFPASHSFASPDTHVCPFDSSIFATYAQQVEFNAAFSAASWASFHRCPWFDAHRDIRQLLRMQIAWAGEAAQESSVDSRQDSMHWQGDNCVQSTSSSELAETENVAVEASATLGRSSAQHSREPSEYPFSEGESTLVDDWEFVPAPLPHLLDMPAQTTADILAYLPAESLISLRNTCTELRAVVDSRLSSRLYSATRALLQQIVQILPPAA